MSYTFTQQINRNFIDKLKSKGTKWLEENLAMEKRMLKTCPEEELPKYELYIKALQKALKEVDLSTTTA
jgi:hypothetical protein